MNYLKDDWIHLMGLAEKLVINVGWNPYINSALKDQMEINANKFLVSKFAFERASIGIFNALDNVKKQ
jgi:hypothetical protein